MEEGVLRGDLRASQLLYVVHDEHVDALVEVHEVVEDVVLPGIRELHHEEVGAQVEDALFGMQLFCAQTDGVYQVRLAHTARTVDEERVECHLLGMFGDGLTDTAGQLVARAFYEVAEALVDIELRVQIVGHSNGLGQQGRLVCLAAGRSRSGSRVLALLPYRHVVRHLHLVDQPDVFAEEAVDGNVNEPAEVFLQIFKEELGRYVNRQLLLGSVKRLEPHGREPSLELLLANVAAEHLHATLPQYLFLLSHVCFLYIIYYYRAFAPIPKPSIRSEGKMPF